MNSLNRVFSSDFPGTTVLNLRYVSARTPRLTPPASKASSIATKNSVTVKWNAVSGATGYVIYYSTSKNGTYKKLGSTKERTFTSSKLSGGRNYYIRAKAYIKTSDGNIYSGASNIKSAYVK